jgi:hypothetical protein
VVSHVYDISRLKTASECQIVLERSKEKEMADVYRAVFKRYCQLVGHENDDPSDPLVAEFFETLAAYEQLLTEKNGVRTTAARTRQKIKNKGIHQSLVEWALSKAATNGFNLLVDAGLPEYTSEYLVVKYADRFPKHVVDRASGRLKEHDIAVLDHRGK